MQITSGLQFHFPLFRHLQGGEGRAEALCLQVKGFQVRVSFLDPLGREGSGAEEPRAVVFKLVNFCLTFKKKIDPTSTNICIYIVYSLCTFKCNNILCIQ